MTEVLGEEIWKPIPSKEGIMASNWGRILLPDRQARMPHGGLRWYRPQPTFGVVTRGSKVASHKYMGISNKFFGNLKVHRLVCEAFHGPPPPGKPHVLHLDEDGTNNRPENLKWGTHKENLNMPKFIEYCKSRTGENNPYVKGRKKKVALEEYNI